MTLRRFIQCDVFAAQPMKGNGLAVVVDGDGLSDAEMQQFAAWTNLAETTFLLPPQHAEADYLVRIFTTRREMPFAGHPTLGSCAAWLKSGGRPADDSCVIQECGIGLVRVHVRGDHLAFEAPPTRILPMDADMTEAVADALELDRGRIVGAATLDNGPVWQAFLLRSAADVLAVDSSRISWPRFLGVGLIGPHDIGGPVDTGKLDIGLIAPHAAGGDFDYEVRMLAPSSGMSEDPITGSLNAALAVWLDGMGRLGSGYTVSQGVCIGRNGRVMITREAGGPILVGGQVQMMIEGTLSL